MSSVLENDAATIAFMLGRGRGRGRSEGLIFGRLAANMSDPKGCALNEAVGVFIARHTSVNKEKIGQSLIALLFNAVGAGPFTEVTP